MPGMPGMVGSSRETARRCGGAIIPRDGVGVGEKKLFSSLLEDRLRAGDRKVRDGGPDVGGLDKE